MDTAKHVIFGAPSDVTENFNQLPTCREVMKCVQFVRIDLEEKNKGKDPSVTDIANIVASRLCVVWRRASIPTMEHRNIVRKIGNYHSKCQKILKSSSRGGKSYEEKVGKLEEEGRQLFDIFTCKCLHIESCTCRKDQKVPEREQSFFLDRRGDRIMMIGRVDALTTRNLKQLEECKKKKEQRIQQYRDRVQDRDAARKDLPSTSTSQSIVGTSPEKSVVDEDRDSLSSSDSEFETPEKRETRQMTRALPSLASACDRTGVSSTEAALLASAALEDFGIVTPEDCANIIDKSKVRRERQKLRRELQECASVGNTEVKRLFFDGRKDNTLIQEKVKNKFYRKEVKEEHISLLMQPGSRFIGHVTPVSGSAQHIVGAITKFLKESSYGLGGILVAGCDGTAVNTGVWGGVVRLLEEQLGRPVQWDICLLHYNELPLRHLLQKLDGHTSGPYKLSGPIGAQLNTCETLQVTEFEAIPVDWPNKMLQKNITDLSTDQDYLLRMCAAISCGECDPDLALKNPGRLSHSRWLTAANRLLRLYVATEAPSHNLILLVNYILRVYAVTWFSIKYRPGFEYGSRHLWQSFKLSREYPEEVRAIIDPVMKRNAFFAHAENVLVNMLRDERPDVRKMAWGHIRSVRQQPSSQKFRRFSVPDVNLDASEYINIIDWNTALITEPLLTKYLSNNKVLHNFEFGTKLDLEDIPCHTQAVERHVKLITEAAAFVCRENARDGFIRARLGSREQMPKFLTKSDYIPKKSESD